MQSARSKQQIEQLNDLYRVMNLNLKILDDGRVELANKLEQALKLKNTQQVIDQLDHQLQLLDQLLTTGNKVLTSIRKERHELA